MSIVPILTPKKLLMILLKAGFHIVRQKGSHVWLTNPITQKSTTIAIHTRDFSRKMIATILKQAGISIQEFLRSEKVKKSPIDLALEEGLRDIRAGRATPPFSTVKEFKRFLKQR